MLKTETLQNMKKTSLHKPFTETNIKHHMEMNSNPRDILKQALQQPLLLAPPPTPSKHRGSLTQHPTESESSEQCTNSPHFPDHLGCGEVFTWHCEGEFYAVECRLCDDHPLCPLSEFPLHMEAWHTDWSGKLTIDGEDMDMEDDEEEQNDLYHVLALSPQNNEDSGLCDYDHEPDHQEIGQHLLNSSPYDEEDDILEPFEQVLIEQDHNIDTTQVNENEVENEVEAVEDGEGEKLVTEVDGDNTTTTVLPALTPKSCSIHSNNEEEPDHQQPKQSETISSSSNGYPMQPAVSMLKHSKEIKEKQEQIANITTATIDFQPRENGEHGDLRAYSIMLNIKEETQEQAASITKENGVHEDLRAYSIVLNNKEENEETQEQNGTTINSTIDIQRRENGEHGDLRELTAYSIVLSNKEEILLSESQATTINDEEKKLLADEVTGSGVWNDDLATATNLVEESYECQVKPEIPIQITSAGEIAAEDNDDVDEKKEDLQHFTATRNFEENRKDKKKPNLVEITKVDFLNIQIPTTEFVQQMAPNAEPNSSIVGRFSPRKRKRQEKPESATSAQKQITCPPISGKYLKSYKKFLEKTEKESLDPQQQTLEEECSPNNSPLHTSPNEPKRRRIYSRACKKSPLHSEELEESKEILEHCEESSVNNSDIQTFLSPNYQQEFLTCSSASSPSISSMRSPNSKSYNADKSRKIRCLVKQCERIGREHTSSASSTISSVSSSSTTGSGKRLNRRRRSLTPVEVCDILPTVPLNDHLITIDDDTGNMSPQSLSEHLESLACSLLDYDDFPDDDHSVASTMLTGENIMESSPSSPGSPKTEEEHFEFHEPREKLNKTHIIKLLELYQEHSRLWDQKHTEFCEPHLCRQSWENITERWNAFCKRKFHITEVRIRISTLCQRYLKERERIQREGELDESAKFPYYEQMSFLEQHRSLQKRREVYEQQNEKILEIYQKYLVLWHVRWYKVRQVTERTKAFQCISAELKDIGVFLSSTGVQKRIRSLRKCYRLEKIRHLHAQVERIKFEPTFKHYERMQFLDKHIDPFVCRICGKIFESLVVFREHIETSSHGNILEEEDEEDDAKLTLNHPANRSNANGDAVLCGTNEKFEISMTAKDQNSVSVFIKPLAVAQEIEISTSGDAERDSRFTSLPMEDQIMEEIIENVSNENEFATKTLDTYLHSGDSPEDATFFIDSTNGNTTGLEMEQQSDDSASIADGTTAVMIRQDLPKLSGRRRVTKTKAFVIDEEYHSGDGDTQSARLSDAEIHRMISIYKRYRQLWDPNHLDFNSRSLRRQAWFALTTDFNKAIHRNFSWRSLYRKLIDYAKYYKKLTAEQNPSEIKWVFYKDLMFLDDVIAVSNELGKSIHQRGISLKLIEIYKNLPQLWNIRDPDFNKRPVKQRNINIMCNRLQEETNKQINPERIKNRIIEMRTQYRADKKKRLRYLSSKQKFYPDFEFYEEFSFIDSHIDPFECEHCSMDFQKLSDFNNHVRKEHEPKRRRFRNVSGEEQVTQSLDNVCHICGVKFSNRGNLAHHLIRHEGVRNFECSMCPKKFFTSHSLKIHVRTHTKECPYICEKCGLSFVNASKLNQHVLRHTNKKDFKCDHCPKAFFTAFEKERHTRWHLNIRDKNCPICGKSFVKGSSYYAHLMLHSDTKRFECDKCDLKFAQYAGLYKHKKRYHST